MSDDAGVPEAGSVPADRHKLVAAHRSSVWMMVGFLLVAGLVTWRLADDPARTSCRDYVKMPIAQQMKVARSVFPPKGVDRKAARLLASLCADGDQISDYDVKQAAHI